MKTELDEEPNLEELRTLRRVILISCYLYLRNEMISNTDMKKQALALSSFRVLDNKKLDEAGLDCELSNRSVKRRQMNHYGKHLYFTYPKDKRKSQMFFSSDVSTTDVVETLKSRDSVRNCVEILQKECDEFDFKLDDSYASSHDFYLSFQFYDQDRSSSCE